ncbi:hypothetical protein OIU76_025586 [Salix suchowensis]|nr:hypothetical protein OIU76_025586 [Salix suchowensis]
MKSQIPSSQPHSSNKVALGLSTCSSRQSPLPSPLPPLDLDLQPSKSVNPLKTSLLPCWGNAPLAHEVTGHSNEVQAHEHAPPELSSSAEETEDEESSSSDYDSGSNGDSSDLDPEITPSCPVTTNGPPSHATPRDAAEVPGNPKSSSAPIGQWRNLSASNRNSSVCSKLLHFSEVTAAGKCNLLDEDLDIACDVWKSCLIGYVSGEFPGFKALNSIITKSWHCDAVLNLHESGWLVYKFQNEADKLVVLRGGPYIIYGRTLILKEMPEYFDFNSEEMSIVPVWIKLPNLPLKCWSSNCLSKIASVIGKPILSDKSTSSMARLSYARILVEIDIFNDLPQSIDICLPNGCSLAQQVVYETLPKFCKHCRVPGHLLETCTMSPNVKGGDSAQGNK